MKDNWILINGMYLNKNYIMQINPVNKTPDNRYYFDIVMSDGTCQMTTGTDEVSVRDFYHSIVQEVTGDLQQCVSEI